MKIQSPSGKFPAIFSARILLPGIGASLIAVSPLAAQTAYTAVDLTPAAPGAATDASAGLAAGFTGLVPNAFSGRATLWTGDGPVDLHPAFLEGAGARATVSGWSGNLQVGSGAPASTSNRNVPLAWSGSAAGATILNP